ncbi:hypothetical protein ABG768_012538 [Culter alburnus]|uniref:Uncharacterized protein n=1 Tax=Culter alburnus TaxID=194366 RepID=A0AAW2B1P8_CULAL
MSCTILYLLLLLLLSCAYMSEVQQEENEVQAESPEQRGAVLITAIYTELTELKSTVNSLKNKLEDNEKQLEQLRRNGNPLFVLISLVKLADGK